MGDRKKDLVEQLNKVVSDLYDKEDIIDILESLLEQSGVNFETVWAVLAQKGYCPICCVRAAVCGCKNNKGEKIKADN